MKILLALLLLPCSLNSQSINLNTADKIEYSKICSHKKSLTFGTLNLGGLYFSIDSTCTKKPNQNYRRSLFFIYQSLSQLSLSPKSYITITFANNAKKIYRYRGSTQNYDKDEVVFFCIKIYKGDLLFTSDIEKVQIKGDRYTDEFEISSGKVGCLRKALQ